MKNQKKGNIVRILGILLLCIITLLYYLLLGNPIYCGHFWVIFTITLTLIIMISCLITAPTINGQE